MRVTVVGDHMARLEHLLCDFAGAAQLRLVVLDRAQTAADFEETGAEAVLAQQRQHLLGISRMRAIVERESDGFGSEVVAEHFPAGGAPSHGFHGLGGRLSKLTENPLAAEMLAQKAHVSFPLFARRGAAPGCELGEDARDLLAISELDRLQIVVKSLDGITQRIARSGNLAGGRGVQLLNNIEKREFVGIVQATVGSQILNELPHSIAAAGLRQPLIELVDGALLAPEDLSPRGDAPRAERLVQTLGAVHQHNDLAEILGNGGKGRTKRGIGLKARLEEALRTDPQKQRRRYDKGDG